ncbi:MAG: acyltransferase family protein [Agathobacter sp.]|uniref:acyltransferase family protein n=1 Tax=Agathobacter sp. TaxID=2021311 RepID=UPI00259075C4|nr:acyltransferase family protein [Agathobacter sp.]MCR5677494.1 acyltransferase family protein [Agathobacter sp.]
MERDYYFDNLKALLIFLVVLGHFLLPIEPKDSMQIAAFKRLIYVFHMPLFVFVTGYFSKHIYKDGHYNWEKIFFFLKCYLLFVILNHMVAVAIGEEKITEIDFLKQSGAPWYLFATMIWYLSIPLVRRIHPMIVLGISVLLALLAGNVEWVGDFLCLSRIIVFAVYFYLGYFANATHIKRILQKRNAVWVFPIAAVMGYEAIRISLHHKRAMLTVYQNLPYSMVGKDIPGIYLRIFVMVAAFFLSWAVMLLVPKRKMMISTIGQRTMTIYMIHRPIRDLAEHFGFYKLLTGLRQPVWMFLILLLVSAVLTTVLSDHYITQGWNRGLRLHRIGKIQAREFGRFIGYRRVLWQRLSHER